jgi:hypothetical protein
MSVTLDRTSTPFVRCGKKLKLSSVRGDSGSKKCKRGCGGVWRSLFGGSLGSGVRQSVLCWCVWQGSGFSRREDVFTFNLVYKICYKVCAFNEICKDNAAINCITVQHKSFIPVNFDG